MPKSTFTERIALSDKITFIEKYVKQSELAQMLDIDSAYLRKIKATQRSGKKYEASIDDIYKTFKAFGKTHYEHKVSKKELARFSSLRKYSKIKATTHITAKEKHKQDIVIIDFNLKWNEVNKLIVLNRMLDVFNKYSKKSHVLNILFTEFHFIINGKSSVRHYGAIELGNTYELEAHFNKTFIDVTPEKSGTGIWGFVGYGDSFSKDVFLEYVVMRFV